MIGWMAIDGMARKRLTILLNACLRIILNEAVEWQAGTLSLKVSIFGPYNVGSRKE